MIGTLESARAWPTAPTSGDVNYAVRTLPGLRQAVGQVARRTARRRARGGAATARTTRSTSCCGRRPSRASPRMPSGTAPTAAAGPAGTSSARPWPARCSARHFDIHGGGADLQFPAPRERDRAERRRHRQAASPSFWMHNGFVQRRQREDVEVAGQLLHHPRGAGEVRRRDAALLHRARALPQPARTTATCTSTTRATSLKRLYTALDLVAPADAGDRLDRAARRALQGRDGRRLRHARGGGRAVRPGRRGQPQQVGASWPALLKALGGALGLLQGDPPRVPAGRRRRWTRPAIQPR